jgi:hypothetical protein
MAKKLLMGLVPMLAVAAPAVMPAVAQAAPHYYKSGALIPEGEKVAVLEWGKIWLEVVPDGVTGSVTCENLAGGFVENPVGGGAGVGATLRYAAYNCISAECPAGEIEVKGHKYEKEFEVIYSPQSFPWPSVLTEAEPGVVRTNNTGLVLELGCFAHRLTRSAAGEGGPQGAGENEQFVLPSGGPPTVTCVSDEAHKLEPKNEKGSNDGPGQSKPVFNAGAGTLNCAGGAFESKPHESLRVMGYKASELITVR